ncbi:STAS domain-containing protein [Streptomyces sp. NPDC051362]|uniref:STAS domain-containing protein n=1 Tax=Streptomyces sp. NPDC051362 TaxID=3365651 RepID=UPI003790518F
MATDETAAPPIPVIRPSGDLDFHTIGPFAAELQQLCSQHKVVIVDLAGVTFGDSMFLNQIIAAEKLTELRLINIPAVIDRVFAITTVYDILAIYPTLEAARNNRPYSREEQ